MSRCAGLALPPPCPSLNHQRDQLILEVRGQGACSEEEHSPPRSPPVGENPQQDFVQLLGWAVCSPNAGETRHSDGMTSERDTVPARHREVPSCEEETEAETNNHWAVLTVPHAAAYGLRTSEKQAECFLCIV